TSVTADARATRTAGAAALLAAALMISYAESLLPQLVPGFKPGLANLAVMAAFCISPLTALAVSGARVLIFGVLFGNPVSLLMSASGAVLSYLLLYAVCVSKVRAFSWIGVSVLSAACHNAGQLIAACLLTGNRAALSYAPVLAVSTVVCGGVCGLIMNLASPVIEKLVFAAKR
ncbi:MAG: Gx transporter family protein, partial [Clostridia bacterium]|nr:Gx transporter family protein [Clostridia bacterium]